MPILIHNPLAGEFIEEHPKLAVVVGLAFATLFIWFSIHNLQTAMTLPAQPEKLPLSAIAQRLSDKHNELWVEVQGGQWDCASITHKTIEDAKYTEALLVDDSGSVVAIVNFSSHLPCSAIAEQHPKGVVSHYRQDWLKDLMTKNEMGIRQYQGTTVLKLCISCSPGRSMFDAILFLFGAGICLYYPLRLLFKGWQGHVQVVGPLLAGNMGGLNEAVVVSWKCNRRSSRLLGVKTMTLHQEVERFKAWATANHPGEKRYGEWEDDYPAWGALYEVTLKFIASSSPTEWNDMDISDLLYAIARDNESENFADEIAKDSDRLLRLSGIALTSPETDAKWQLAARLGALSDRVQEAEALLLKFVDDKDEYVSRRALFALCDLKSPSVEALAERAWSTGDEYQRLAALSVLEEISSDKLPLYIQRAIEDGREYIVRKARLIQQA